MFCRAICRYSRTRLWVSFRLFIALLALGSLVSRPAQADDPTTVAVFKRVEAKSRAVAAQVMGATVGIINQSLATTGRLGEGSGVVVSEDGLVLTAGHVLGQPGSELTVIFPDGRRAPARALGINFASDSGLARITEPGKWPHVEMGHSDDIKPGTWCVALGHPGGIQQGRTPPVRLGRVLNLGRDTKFLVTDATVISGDSGGPLFDLEGRVVGIHSNIGMNVNQNQHVPIEVYREQWKDLLAGKAIGSPGDLHAGRIPSPEKLKRFRELLLQRLMAGDPEVRDMAKSGHVNLTPADIDRLIAKWEKSPPGGAAAGPAGSRPLDFLKFQRLFQDRLLAGDQDVLRLVKNGTMMVTPEQMHQLLGEWERKSLADSSSQPKAGALAHQAAEKPAETPRPVPAPSAGGGNTADPSSRLREMFGGAKSLGGARYGLPSGPESDRNLLGLAEAIQGRAFASNTADYGKASPTLLHDVAPIAALAGKSTVVVLCDGRPTAWGTVVRKDGYIVTKASEIHGKVSCKIGARELPATLIEKKDEHDLRILKVEAKDLVPIAWADGDPPPRGSWLVTPAPEKDAQGLGVVSVSPRAIPDAPKILLRNRAIAGVVLDQGAKDARIRNVSPNLPAAKAGLKAGNVILSIDGERTATAKDVNQVMGKYRPGDKVALEITRDGKPMKVKVDLVSSDQMAPKANGEQLTHLSQRGGTVSKRHNSFADALTHDTVLQAAECGGPVVDLDGRAIGLNIARADRTATYAIPAATIRKAIDELLK